MIRFVLCRCHKETKSWDEWAADFSWMVPYFGPAVWTSIWLAAKTPVLDEDIEDVTLPLTLTKKK